MGNSYSNTTITDTPPSLINYQEELKHFYVICVVPNPAKSQGLTKLYLKFKQQMEADGVKLVTVECAIGKSPFVITKNKDEPESIQIRSTNSFFQKENLINIALSKLPQSAKYVAWVDCDMEFENRNWAKDTIKALNSARAVQLFEYMVFTDEYGKEVEREKGFTFQFCDKRGSDIDGRTIDESTSMARYAWAFRYEALKQMNGLIDFSPIGNNYKIMANCLLQRVEKYVPGNMTLTFRESVESWQEKAETILSDKISFVRGNIRLSFAKLKLDEQLKDDWRILQTNVFDQIEDLHKDKQGLYCLDSLKPELKKQLKEFYDSVNQHGTFLI